ncbi:MAG: aminopeptidase P family protein [Candidatus Aminicenantes bacterium]|nr:aminopeptidase P family protein [Candidatus Aminicenantes bacterium]
MKHSFHRMIPVLTVAVLICSSSILLAVSAIHEDFSLRRQKIMDFMEDGIAVFRTSEQSSENFFYLTGFAESDAAMLLIPGADKKFILFVRPANPARSIWTGDVAGLEGAKEYFGADEAYPLDQFERILAQSLRGEKQIFCSYINTELTASLFQMVSRPWNNSPKQIVDLTEKIYEMRVIKSPAEISLMKKAVDITCQASIEAMKAAQPGKNEAEIEAVIEYVFRKEGATGPGFPSIVGSGPNSTVLHHEINNRQTVDGDLVVMDIGAEVGRYTADVTRTIPVNGQFSKEQQDIYNIVLEAEEKALSIIAPGIEINDIHNLAVSIIADGLLRLGLITDKESRWQTSAWLMYTINHWIGLNVHDVGDYQRRRDSSRVLEPGMVFTVEPGLYIRMETIDSLQEIVGPSVPEEQVNAFIKAVRPVVQKYNHIGVRIEDDVLVTKDGYENLSVKAPKTIAEIERIMQKK